MPVPPAPARPTAHVGSARQTQHLGWVRLLCTHLRSPATRQGLAKAPLWAAFLWRTWPGPPVGTGPQRPWPCHPHSESRAGPAPSSLPGHLHIWALRGPAGSCPVACRLEQSSSFPTTHTATEHELQRGSHWMSPYVPHPYVPERCCPRTPRPPRVPGTACSVSEWPRHGVRGAQAGRHVLLREPDAPILLLLVGPPVGAGWGHWGMGGAVGVASGRRSLEFTRINEPVHPTLGLPVTQTSSRTDAHSCTEARRGNYTKINLQFLPHLATSEARV